MQRQASLPQPSPATMLIYFLLVVLQSLGGDVSALSLQIARVPRRRSRRPAAPAIWHRADTPASVLHCSWSGGGRGHSRTNLCASVSNAVGDAIGESSSMLGLMSEKDFAYRSAVHGTLTNLRHQLPRTLTVPIKADEAKQTYAKDCALIGPKGEVLGSDREEIISVSQTIATTIGTARRAGQLLAAATSSAGENGDEELNMDLVDCELTLDSSLSVLYVKWITMLPVSVTGALPNSSGTRRRSRREDREEGTRRSSSSSPSPSSSPRPHSKITGSSVFTFNADGLISKHQILDVEIDGRNVDAVGPRLASLRQTVKSVTERSPWVLEAAEAAAPLLTSLAELAVSGGRQRPNEKEEVGGAEQKGKRQNLESKVIPICIADVQSSQRNNSSIWKTSSRWEVDDDATQNMTHSVDQYPLPGGNKWESYEMAHGHLQSFAKTTVPYLSGEIDSAIFPIPDGKSLRDFFASDVELKAFDGTALVSGSGRVADLYRAVSGLRRSGGRSDPEDGWRIIDVSVDWNNRTATVKWLSTIQIRVEGTDIFYLNENGEIKEIVQKELTVGGNKIIDAVWIQSIISAVESSRGGAGGEILGDVLKRISRGRSGSRSTGQVDSAPKKNTQQVPPDLDDVAAATVYNIMRVLHAELPSLVDATAPAFTPARQFLSGDVELRGLLDETLARGTAAYSQALTTSIGSLRAALRTGSVRSVKDVVPRIELLASGSIQVDVKLALRIEAPSLLPSLSPRDKGINNSQGQASLGFPLELELISLYKVDRRGKIMEHRIVENKINGRKSPADVVSNWIKGGGETSSPERAALAFVDAVKWARTLSENLDK
jgi:hypothetical protein